MVMIEEPDFRQAAGEQGDAYDRGEQSDILCEQVASKFGVSELHRTSDLRQGLRSRRGVYHGVKDNSCGLIGPYHRTMSTLKSRVRATYVSVLSGIGGLWWNSAREQLKGKVPQGGSGWTFAVID